MASGVSSTLRSLLAPEVILPGQLDGAPQRGAAGERALMLAVLEDAIRCLTTRPSSARGGGRRLARRAEAWIASRDRDWPFSFVNVCEALGFDPCSIRAALLAPSGAGARVPGTGPYRLRVHMALGRRAARIGRRVRRAR